MRRVDSLEKTLMLGGIGGRRRRGRRRMRWLDGIIDSMDVSLSELREWVMDREAWCVQFMGSQRAGHDWATELNWTELNMIFLAINVYLAYYPLRRRQKESGRKKEPTSTPWMHSGWGWRLCMDSLRSWTQSKVVSKRRVRRSNGKQLGLKHV